MSSYTYHATDRVETSFGTHAPSQQLTSNEPQVSRREQLHMHAREAVEEAAWQALAAASLLDRVLSPEQSEPRVALVHRAQLWDEDLSPVLRQEMKGGQGGSAGRMAQC